MVQSVVSLGSMDPLDSVGSLDSIDSLGSVDLVKTGIGVMVVVMGITTAVLLAAVATAESKPRPGPVLMLYDIPFSGYAIPLNEQTASSAVGEAW